MHSAIALRARTTTLVLAAVTLGLALHAPPADALRVQRCWIPDVGGVVEFPPLCPEGFQSAAGMLGVENGLPAGSPLLARFELKNIVVGTRTPGGPLGGEVQDWTADLYVHFTGTGLFAGYSRTIGVGTIGKTASGPQVPGLVVQSFATDLLQCFGQILSDPDFDLLRVTAGTNFGMPSPGQGAFVLTSSGDRTVDSFFDITYRVDFIGAAGGPFAGMSGSTNSQMRARAGMPERIVCSVPEIGSGTAEEPPQCPNGWESEPQAPLALNGMPPGQPLEARIRIIPSSPYLTLGPGQLGGRVWDGTGTIEVEIVPLNLMSAPAPYVVTIPAAFQFDLGPEVPGTPRQGVAARLKRLQGQIVGDPDFDLLRITGGYDFGMPGSEGHVTLTHAPGGTWLVDSFFDITYRVDFIGAAGGPLAGRSGSTTSLVEFEEGDPDRPLCMMPDNGGGTADFPPLCLPGYDALVRRPAIESGMPPGNPLLGSLLAAMPAPPLVAPGGTLGGEMAQGPVNLRLQLQSLISGYNRTVLIPGQWQVHSAPRFPGTSPQRFETDVFDLQGQIVGDPDFDLLRINGGTNLGYPSPGHTTFTNMGGGNWSVDSFFDITYRVDFVGAIGGPFAGMSGSTTLVDRIAAGKGTIVGAPPPALPRALALSPAAPNPTREGATVWLDLPAPSRVRAGLYDVAGRQVASLADRAFEAGRHEIRWDGRESDGAAARAGMYFVRVRTGAGTADRAVVVVP